MSTASPSLLRRQLRLVRITCQGILWIHMFCDRAFSIGDTIGASMLPTFNVSGDWVLISKLHKRGRELEVGDLISYLHPVRGPGVSVIKRIIGMPGDFVVKDPTDGTGEMLQVPPGHVWTTGDNLPHSLDSRYYGPVPLALIRGKVIARLEGEKPWFGPSWMPNPFAWSWIENPLKEGYAE